MPYDKTTYQREWRRKRRGSDPKFAEREREIRRKSYHKYKKRNRAKSRAAHHAGYRTVIGRARYMLHSVNKRARSKDWKCDLSLEWVVEQIARGTCSVTGIPFDLEGKSKGKFHSAFAPSIDRIDCNKGYTEDNCRVVVTALNGALNQWGEEVFERVALAFVSARRPELFYTQRLH